MKHWEKGRSVLKTSVSSSNKDEIDNKRKVKKYLLISITQHHNIFASYR